MRAPSHIMSRLLHNLIGLLVVCAFVGVDNSTTVAQDTTQSTGDNAIIFREDRGVSESIARAERLIEAKNWTAAGSLLADVLSKDDATFYRPISRNPANGSRAAAVRLVSKLSAKGLDAYRLRLAVASCRALDAAVHGGKFDELIKVARQYPHTPAAYESMYLAGRHCYDAGRPATAAIYLGLVYDSPKEAKRFEPRLSLMLATCLKRVGKQDKAEDVFKRLVERHPAAVVRIAGEDIGAASSGSSSSRWLSDQLGRETVFSSRPLEWSGFRGGPQRLAQARGEGPLIEPVWVSRLGELMEDAAVLAEVRELHEAYRQRNLAILPSAYPIVVGSQVIVRANSAIIGFDASTGKINWSAELAGAKEGDVRSARQHTSVDELQEQPAELATRLWGDALAGQISSDGKLVFAIEGQTVPEKKPSSFVFGVAGDPAAKSETAFNQLVAIDTQAEGKRRWTVSGSESPVAEHPATTFFLGAPLPLDGRLYTIAERDHRIQLVVLDAATGRHLWTLHLADLDPLRTLSSLRRVYGVSPSFADGVLICPTSAGAFVAVDVVTRSLRWGYKLTAPWQSNDANLTRGIAGAALIRILQQQGLHERMNNRWWDEVAMLAEDRVLITSPSDQKLRCLDLASGRQLWTFPPTNIEPAKLRDLDSIFAEKDSLYVGGVIKDDVVIVCRSRIIALRLEDGTAAWKHREIPLPSGGVAPSGRGVVCGDSFLLPLDDGTIATIDVPTGKLIAIARSPRSNSDGWHGAW